MLTFSSANFIRQQILVCKSSIKSFVHYSRTKNSEDDALTGNENGPASGNAIENLGETKIRPFAPASPRKCKYFAQNTTKTICQILHYPKYCRSHHISSQIFVSTIVYIVINKMYFNYWQGSLTIIIRFSNFKNRSNAGEYLPP